MKKVSLLFLIMALKIAFVQPSFLHTMLERITNPKGRTPLMEAILYNASDDVFNQALARAQATNTVNNLDVAGKSALDYAIEGKRLNFATQLSRVLSLRKINPRIFYEDTILGDYNLPTFEEAVPSMEDLITKLTEHGSETRRLFFWLLAKNFLQEALIKEAKKASPNISVLLLLRCYGGTFHTDQFYCSFDMINRLDDKDIEPKIALFVKLGANINWYSLLDIIQYNKDVKPTYIQALLKNGLDFTKKDIDGQTCLHYAISNDQNVIFPILLAHIQTNNRQDLIDAQSSEGNTALHQAANSHRLFVKEKNKKHYINLLLAAGANTSLQNKRGLTPLECSSSQEIRDLFVPKQLLP